MNQTVYKTILDAKGLVCPLPLLKMKLALKKLEQGECLKVWATDKTAIRDFASYCDLSQHQLISVNEINNYIEFIIQKG